eukprot:422707_1
MQITYIPTWLSIISLFISLLFSLFIIYRNYKHKKKSDNDTFQTQYLTLWSSITFITIIIGIIIFILNKFPIICQYSMTLGFAAFISPKVFVTYFQLARLQLLFTADKLSHQFAYHKYLFIPLYFIGFIVIISSALLIYIVPNHMTVSTDHKPDNICTAIQTYLSILLSLSIGTLFCIWAWVVVGLYVVKMVQLKQQIGSNIHNQQIKDCLQKINFTLNKIVFLTLLMEIVGICVGGGQLFITYDISVAWSIDFSITISLMYLMREHNCKDYAKLLLLLNKCGCIKCCCCCFRNLNKKERVVPIKIAQQCSHSVPIKQNKIKNTTEHEETDTGTKKSNIVMHIKCVQQSETTQTVEIR